MRQPKMAGGLSLRRLGRTPLVVTALILLGSRPLAGAEPAVESRDDALLERIVDWTQAWGELGVGKASHAPGAAPKLMRIKDEGYSKGLESMVAGCAHRARMLRERPTGATQL